MAISRRTTDSRRSGSNEQALTPLEFSASQAALAISNARLFAQAERRSSKLRGVLDLSREINSAYYNLNRVLETACQKAVDLLDVDHSALVLFDSDLESGRVYAEYPLIMLRGSRVQLRGVPLEEELITSRSPIRIQDVANEAKLGQVRNLMLKFDIRSSMFVPVINRNRIIGSFSLDSIGKQRLFTDDELALCQILAEQIAVTIENAKLFDETHRRAEQLEDLQQKSVKITHDSLQDRAALLDLVIEQAIKLLNAKNGGIYEYN